LFIFLASNCYAVLQLSIATHKLSILTGLYKRIVLLSLLSSHIKSERIPLLIGSTLSPGLECIDKLLLSRLSLLNLMTPHDIFTIRTLVNFV
jgi:hypothetical protein